MFAIEGGVLVVGSAIVVPMTCLVAQRTAPVFYGMYKVVLKQ